MGALGPAVPSSTGDPCSLQSRRASGAHTSLMLSLARSITFPEDSGRLLLLLLLLPLLHVSPLEPAKVP